MESNIMAPKSTPTEKKQGEQTREESTKEHQYGAKKPTTERPESDIDADENRRTSIDATGGPDKPTA